MLCGVHGNNNERGHVFLYIYIIIVSHNRTSSPCTKSIIAV